LVPRLPHQAVDQPYGDGEGGQELALLGQWCPIKGPGDVSRRRRIWPVKAFQSAGDYFVLGDNRAKSCDSRSFGAIPGSLVVGKVVGIVWRHNQFDVHFL